MYVPYKPKCCESYKSYDYTQKVGWVIVWFLLQANIYVHLSVCDKPFSGIFL